MTSSAFCSTVTGTRNQIGKRQGGGAHKTLGPPEQQPSPYDPRASGSHTRPLGGWVPKAVHPAKANQGSPVLEPHRIPLEHYGWTVPMLVRAISLGESVPETLLFGTPAFHFTLRTRLTLLLPTPVYASDEGEAGICQTLTVKEVTILTTRTRLLEIFEILPPGWSHTIHDMPPSHADRKEVRRPHRILGERAAKAAYESAE